MINETLAVYFE